MVSVGIYLFSALFWFAVASLVITKVDSAGGSCPQLQGASVCVLHYVFLFYHVLRD